MMRSCLRFSRQLLSVVFFIELGTAVLSPHPLRAAPGVAAQARAAYWTGTYLKGIESVQELAAQGAPAGAISVLREHERSAQPRLRALAKALLYRHAARLHLEAAERDRLRGELITVADDPSAPGLARDEACRALLDSDWEGRDAYYLKLVADPSLRALQDGVRGFVPLLEMLRRDPDRWVPRLLLLLQQPGEVRSNVAYLLAQLDDTEDRPPRRDVAVALLPWLADREWAKGVQSNPSPRANYITSLELIDLKESVPGLIHVVQTEHDYAAARAAHALIKYRDPRALPALRAGLLQHLNSGWEREAFTAAIAACGGVSPAAGVAVLEAYARVASTPDGMERVRASRTGSEPIDATLAQGIQLAHAESADEALVAALIQRLDALRPAEPQVALALEAPLFAWDVRAAQRHVVARLSSDGLDDTLLHHALSARRTLGKSCGEELRALQRRGGTGAGRAVIMLEDSAAMQQLAVGGDAAAILGLFHAATVSDRQGLDPAEDWDIIARDPTYSAVRLPAALVGPLLLNANAAVAAAARAFLTREGGPTERAWLATGGRPPKARAPTVHHFNIAGVVPGMTRAQAAGASSGNIGVGYADNGRVVRVVGRTLRDGTRLILSPRSTAAAVRSLLGRPDREGAGHIYSTVGGFFWRYERNGQVLDFVFRDNDQAEGLGAPLFQVSLLAPSPPAAH